METSRSGSGGGGGGGATAAKGEDKGIKVKHISSPVMVKAKDPSQFKQIVQHFTGQTPNEANFTAAAAATTGEPDSAYKTEIYGWSWKEIADRHGH